MNQRLSTLFSTLQGRTRGGLLFLALVATTTLWAHDFEVNGIYYNILTDKTNEVAVTYRGSSYDRYYDEYMGSVTIPSTVTYNGTTYSVTSIGNYAFAWCSSLTSVTIGNSVTSIGEYAFEGCSGLTSITIPNSVTSIGSSAFSGCKGLTSITIPNSVTSIGSSVFYGCSGLTSIVVEEGNTVYDSRDNCNAIIKTATNTLIIGCQNTTIPNSVTSIGERAFYECSSLTSITIPNSVTSIGNYAFAWCSSLTSVTIGNSVTSIGEYAFEGCSGLTSVTIGNSVTSIGESAFHYCSSLTTITIPNSVTSLGSSAFYNCSSLTSITIPNSVTSIGSSAFYNCSSLTTITIPNSVTSIGSTAFYNCSSLTSPVYNAHCFAYMPTSYSGAYTIPEGIKQIAGYAFYNCSSLTSITIPNSVTSIGGSAFSGCSSLTSITIPNSVTSIGSSAFYGCVFVLDNFINNSSLNAEENNYWEATIANKEIDGLLIKNDTVIDCRPAVVYVTIPNSVTSIGDYAFRDCRSLTSITIPNSVTSIGIGAFYDCSSLTSITIPNSVTSIGIGAFYNCSGLTSITIPNSVTSIGSSAFYGCSGLTSITSLAEVPPTLGTYAFYNVSTTIPVYVCAVSAYQSAEGWKAFTNIQELLVEYSIAVGVNDSIMGTAMVDYNTYCEGAQITATANQGYHFVQWSDGNTDNPRALVLTQDTTFTAEFAPNQYQLSLATNYSEMGSVQGAGTYDYLTEIEISATANYGYHFTQWNDGNTDNPRVVQVTEDMAYTAQFDKNIYTITTYCDNQMGSVSAPDSAEYLDEITISATANYGYHFVQWSDGNTDNPRALVLTQDTAFTAEFAVSYSGQCGDDLYWAYDEDSKKISITGSGDMYNYTKSTQPWYFFQEQITEVTTSNTTTSIGTSAFEGCVRLGKVSLGYGMENIAAKAFAECKRLYDIYCYASYPPFAEQSSFANYNVYVYIPCEYQRDYTLDVVWGEFKFIECIGAESDDTGGDDIVITPGSTDVTITWPTENNADTYTIVIKKVGEVVCTLTFNADGQLLNIAFAPGRQGNHPAQYAEATTNGYRFTVTDLEEGTDYTYTVTSKDAANKTISEHSGEFTTKSATALDNTHSQSPITNVQKIFRDGQLIIIRDGVEYDALGQEL